MTSNPFFDYIGDLYLRYDSIKISNASEMDGGGVEAGYYWRGCKVCIFPVKGITLQAEMPSGSINLDGINGAIKMVIIDKGN